LLRGKKTSAGLENQNPYFIALEITRSSFFSSKNRIFNLMGFIYPPATNLSTHKDASSNTLAFVMTNDEAGYFTKKLLGKYRMKNDQSHDGLATHRD